MGHERQDDTVAVTKGDLRYLEKSLVEAMRDGFRGVHARQDVTNGRIQKLEVKVAQDDIRIKHIDEAVGELNATVFSRRREDHPRDDRDDGADDVTQPDERRALTRRDFYLVAGTLTTGVTAAAVLGRLVIWLLQSAVKGAP